MQAKDYGLTETLYSIDDVCKKFGVGRNAVYALIHSGEIVPVKFGRKTILPTPDLLRVIENRRGMTNKPMQYRAVLKP